MIVVRIKMMKMVVDVVGVDRAVGVMDDEG